MVTIKADRLEALIGDIFNAAGCSRREADRIARYLVAANLAGHDSHGVVRVPRYVEMTKDGRKVWEWRVWEHLDPVKDPITALQDDRSEWTHGNGLIEHPDVIVFPDAEIVRADAPFGRYRGRFGENERSAAHRAAAEMNEVPVVGEAVNARVLAHRRDNDAVGKREALEGERVEEVRHAPHSMVSIDSRRREAEAVGVQLT